MRKKWQKTLFPKLTPEQILIWLDEQRQFLFEIWKNNPELRKRWEKAAKTTSSS